MVSDLMDLDTKSWNLDLINCIFLPFEAENIGGIPLKNWFPDDKQIWVVHIKLVQFVFAGEKLVEFVFEGNSLILVQEAPTFIARLIYGVQGASYEFQSVRFSHVRRKGKVPAHLLVKHALGNDDFSLWIEESSSILEQALLLDVFVTFIS